MIVLLCCQHIVLAKKTQAAAGISIRARSKASKSKEAVSLPVPRGTIHHIYSKNATAEAAWTSCSPEAFPQGTWVGSNPRKHSFATGSALYGTAKVQRFIWAHQHPADCSAARYLVYHPKRSGIGSVLHHMGQVGSVNLSDRQLHLHWLTNTTRNLGDACAPRGTDLTQDPCTSISIYKC